MTQLGFWVSGPPITEEIRECGVVDLLPPMSLPYLFDHAGGIVGGGSARKASPGSLLPPQTKGLWLPGLSWHCLARDSAP
jgi:hypothetical protein